VRDAEAARRLLARQLTAPVRWVESMQTASGLAGGVGFLEIGPGTVLAGLLKKIVPGAAVRSVGTADEVSKFLESAA
jgi:[acyl-carrier-protein] S-malonyltransferase